MDHWVAAQPVYDINGQWWIDRAHISTNRSIIDSLSDRSSGSLPQKRNNYDGVPRKSHWHKYEFIYGAMERGFNPSPMIHLTRTCWEAYFRVHLFTLHAHCSVAAAATTCSQWEPSSRRNISIRTCGEKHRFCQWQMVVPHLWVPNDKIIISLVECAS